MTAWASAQDVNASFTPPEPVKTVRPKAKALPVVPRKADREKAVLPTLPASSTARQVSLFQDFPEPLQPVEGEVKDQSTAFLVPVINQWAARKAPDDFSMLEAFVAQHPESAWTPGVQYNLGRLYYSGGYFSRAMEAYQAVQRMTLELPGVAAEKFRASATAELAAMYARTGREKELAALLAQEKGQAFADNAKVQLDRAREGLSVMASQPEIAFRCGTDALANVARKLARPVPPRFMDANPSAREGFSLAQLQDIAARQLGFTPKVVKRKAGKKIPVPSVIHLRCGHYAALLEEANGQFLLSDPTFGSDIWVTRKAVEDEASGYFLVSAASMAPDYGNIPEAEAAGVFGRGYPKATKQCDRKSGGTCGGPGMAGYQFHLLTASLSVSDTPLVLPVSYGPGLFLTVTYNQREANQSSSRLYTHFGPQWVCNLVSWLEDNTFNDAAAVTVYLPGGGSEVDAGYTSTGASQGYYELERESSSRIQRVGAGHYERRQMDGSKLVYQRAIGSSGSARKVFLSQMVDPWGNTLNFSYDSTYTSRVNTVTAASGQVLHFFYADAADPYLVTGAADDANIALTNRKVGFAYQVVASQQRLASVTDPVGIVSSFAYDTSGFMATLTTPYGVSQFSTGGGEEHYLLRWLQAKDTQGDTERVEYRSNGDASTISASPLPAGAGVTTAPEYRATRNTFYWDKKAWRMAPWNRTKAHMYHWLHSPVGTDACAVLEMEKPAFENNVWYNYAGQPSSDYPGPNGSPSAISRAVEGPTGATESAVQLMEYHALTGNLTKSTDALGRVTRYTYDATGYDLLAVEIKDGVNWIQVSGFSNYLNHQPQTLVDAAGQTTTVTYTTEGQVATVTNALNEIVTLAYETNSAANGFGKVKTVTGAQAGSTTSFTYDSYDRVRTVTDSSGYVLTYDYDALDRPTLVTHPDGTTEQLVYDKLDVFAKKDRENRWARTWHNALGQPLLSSDSLGRVLHFEWCHCGALQKLFDEKGNLTRWQYDEQGRNIAKFYADGRQEAYGYQPLSGRMSTSTDSKSQVKTMAYFLDGATKSVTYSNATVSTPSVSFTYDPVFPGRLLTMTDGTGTTSHAYHAAGGAGALQLSSANGPLTGATDLITSSYDNLGRLLSRNIGSVGNENTFTNVYDSLGRVTSVINNLGTFGYFYVDQTSRLDHIDYPNGQKSSFDYHNVAGGLRLKTMHHLADGTVPGSTLSRFDYTYTASGNITTWKRQTGAAAATIYKLEYDALDQLVSATLGDDATPSTVLKRHAYHYDKSGNRDSSQNDSVFIQAAHNSRNQITGTGGGGKLLVEGHTDEPAKVIVNGQAAEVDASSRYHAWVDVTTGTNTITVAAQDYAPTPNTATKQWEVTVPAATARTFTYDENGNTLSDGLRTYEWDAEDRIVKITQGTNVWEFVYDGLSRRVAEKFNGSVIRRWVWHGLDMAEERNDAGVVTSRYFGHGEQRIGGSDAGLYYYTTDHLSSVQELTDNTAAVQARYEYDPWGKRTKASGDLETVKGFTGHYMHENGLVMAPLRAYDPAIGRWLSADPIKENGGLNLYAYCNGNPINFSDPSGLIFGLGVSFGEIFQATSDSFNDGSMADVATGGLGAFLDGIIPFADPYANAGVYDKCDSTFDSANSSGELVRNMWGTYLGARGLTAMSPTGGMASIAYGTGAPPLGFHIAYGAGMSGQATTWVHAIGPLFTRWNALVVTTYNVGDFLARRGTTILSGIPVFHAPAATPLKERANSCITSAITDIARGWGWPF